MTGLSLRELLQCTTTEKMLGCDSELAGVESSTATKNLLARCQRSPLAVAQGDKSSVANQFAAGRAGPPSTNGWS